MANTTIESSTISSSTINSTTISSSNLEANTTLSGDGTSGGGVTINTSDWDIPYGVMMLGSLNNGHTWGYPGQKQGISDVYPVMLLNSCTSLFFTFDEIGGKIYIYCKCETEGVEYVGLFITSIDGLSNSELILCTPSDSEIDFPFYFRPPDLPSNSALWTDSRNIISEKNNTDPEHQGVSSTKGSLSSGAGKDKFFRILGPPGTGCFVTANITVSTIVVSPVQDSNLVLIYDAADGIKCIISISGGLYWYGSGVLMAKEATSGILIGQYLFYISGGNLVMKKTDLAMFYDLMKHSYKTQKTGNSLDGGEGVIQDSFDNAKTTTVFSGSLSPQKMTGYVTPEGIIRIYFRVDGVLMNAYSKNNIDWISGDPSSGL